ncbi:MAG: RNA polymerase sigma factor [Candidatus Krumholzibacteriota bacterium]|nr:RNA polymerase sigma factor [Candidatus Krumholzibacteriota bacterium]
MAPARGEKDPLPAAKERDFENIYVTCRAAVYGFAFHLTGNREESDELFQETWLRVIRNLSKLPEVKNIRGWIYTIMINLHRDNLRRKRLRRLVFPRKIPVPGGGEGKSRYRPEETGPAAPDRTDSTGLGRAIDQAVAALPVKMRAVFILKEMEGFKQREIAALLHIPQGTVKSLLYRALQRLRRELEPWKNEY